MQIRPGAVGIYPFQEAVVLRHAFAAVRRPTLDLSRIQGNGQVGNGCIFCFARSVGNDGPITGAMCHFDGFQRFRYRTDLIELDEDGIAAAPDFARDFLSLLAPSQSATCRFLPPYILPH